MWQTTLHREVEEHDRERELNCTPHNEKTVSLACFQSLSQTISKRGQIFPHLLVGSRVMLSRKWRFWRVATDWFLGIAFLTSWCCTSGASSQNILYDGNCTYPLSIKIAKNCLSPYVQSSKLLLPFLEHTSWSYQL